MSRRDSAASRSSSARGTGARSRTRSDGKVDVGCPQCGTLYRLPAEQLDQKIECSECHRVFFAKTTAGKRVKPPDHTKAYVGFGVAAVALVVLFLLMSGGGDKPNTQPEPTVAPRAPAFGRGSHPRALQLVQWAQGVAANNEVVIARHTDLAAAAAQLGVTPGDAAAVLQAMQTHESTRFLRELSCESAELATDADMEAPSGKAMVFVVPKPGDDTYRKNANGQIEVSWRADGETLRVTAWQVALPPVRNPYKADPSVKTFKPNKDIARPTEVEITDSGGTRKVQESQPAAVPHWEQATPELQQFADAVVADVLKSAEPEAPGALLTRATLRVRSDDQRKAVVPRLLNAMYEHYGDVMANNMKLSQLNRAMVAIIGFAVNYQVEDTGNAAKDKADRESCVRQWFAFWWKHSNDFSKWVEAEESLEPSPTTAPKK